jgi:hypothetical protein
MLFHVVSAATATSKTRKFEGTLNSQIDCEYHPIPAALAAEGLYQWVAQPLYAQGCMLFHIISAATATSKTRKFEGTLNGQITRQYHPIPAAFTTTGQHWRIVQHSLYAAGIALYHGHLPTTAGELRVCTRR